MRKENELFRYAEVEKSEGHPMADVWEEKRKKDLTLGGEVLIRD